MPRKIGSLYPDMKYGALIDQRGSVQIEMIRHEDDALEIKWKEIGGAPIKTPPTRKGFGMTIIERSIPFELNGEADISFKTSGVEARFIIPPAYVSSFEDREQTNKTEVVVEPSSDTTLSGHVLIVEDNVIIAMDAEDIVSELGASSVSVASDVNAAIDVIAKFPISFALLDFNLGMETSEPVAADLVEKGIPFAFATGYGASKDITARFKNAPVLQKPYNKASIQTILANLNF